MLDASCNLQFQTAVPLPGILHKYWPVTQFRRLILLRHARYDNKDADTVPNRQVIKNRSGAKPA
ncbi:MAG: hypothetical protein ACLQNE_17600 [Thermoguttaceae bacterium]